MDNKKLLDLVTEVNTPVNAMECSRLWSKRYDEKLDWHEFSNALDVLCTQKLLWLVGHNSSGMAFYKSATS